MLGGVGVGSGRGASVREKNITKLGFANSMLAGTKAHMGVPLSALHLYGHSKL